MKSHILTLVSTCVSLGVLTASAEVWTTDRSDALVLTEDYEIEVAKGSTVTMGGVISGDYKVTKTGGGTLKLAAANTFSGGLTINEGFVYAENAGALGSGKATVNGDGTKDCQLVFACQDATFANDIDVTGSSNEKCALGFYLPGSTVEIPGATLTGTLTATGDLGIRDFDGPVGGTSTSQSYILGKITGPINAAGHTVACGPCGLVYLYGAITADRLLVYPAISMYRGRVHLGSSANRIGVIEHAYCRIQCDEKDSLGGALVRVVKYQDDDYRNNIAMMGKAQTIAALESGEDVALGALDYRSSAGGTAVTLTITGLVDRTEATTVHKLYAKVSLNVNAEKNIAFTQIFAGRNHDTTGSITAKRGGIRMTGGCSFSNVTSLAVNYNSRFEVCGTCEDSLKSLTSFTLGQGKFTIADGADRPFPDKQVALNVQNSGGELRIPEGMTLFFKSIKASDNPVPVGVYTAGNCTFCKLTGGGEIRTLGPGEEHVWTGRGQTASPADPGNWDDGTVAQDLGSDHVTVRVAPDAVLRRMEISGPTFIHGLNVPSGDFEIVAAAGATDAQVVLGSDGIVAGVAAVAGVSAATDASVTVSVPVVCEDLQSWQMLTAGSAITFTAGGSGPGAITKVGDGTLSLIGDFLFTGNFNVNQQVSTGALVRVAGRLGNGPGTFNYSYVKGNYLWLSNAVIDKALAMAVNNSDRKWLSLATGTTNVLGTSGDLSLGTTFFIEPPQDATLVWEAGGQFQGGKVQKTGKGTLVFRRNPIACYSRAGGFDASFVAGYGNNTGTIRWEIPDNQIRQSWLQDGSRVEFGVDYAFRTNADFMAGLPATSKDGMCYSRFATRDCNTGVCDFEGTKQGFSYVWGGGNASFTGRPGSAMEIFVGLAAESCATTNLSANIDGALSVTMRGAKCFRLKSRAFSSSGDLTAESGVLELTDGATWLNGTNFTAKGTGLLRFTSAGQVSRRIAAFHFADEGRIELPAGTTYEVRSADVGGVAADPGTYAAGDGSAVGAHLAGEGLLCVRGHGLMLLIR